MLRDGEICQPYRGAPKCMALGGSSGSTFGATSVVQKLAVLFCGALLLSVASRAYAAPPELPISASVYSAPSIYSALTIDDFLIACRGDQIGCADKVGTALMDKMTFDGTANICLPSTDYAEAVPEWLNSHPETHKMPTEDGIFLSLKNLYYCG
jgi:hypothetical protein